MGQRNQAERDECRKGKIHFDSVWDTEEADSFEDESFRSLFLRNTIFGGVVVVEEVDGASRAGRGFLIERLGVVLPDSLVKEVELSAEFWIELHRIDLSERGSQGAEVF